MEPIQNPNPLKDYELHKTQPADKEVKITAHQAVELFVKTAMLQEVLTTIKTMTHLFKKNS